MPAVTCQYGSCLEDVGDDGIVVTLKKPTFDEEKRAIYCCAFHAALGLLRLAIDRGDTPTSSIANHDGSKTVGIWLADGLHIPRRWRVT